MRPKHLLFTVIFATLILGGGAIAGDHEFVGAKKCKTCHGKADIGDQNAAWAKTPHAKAMESLKTDQAKEWAKEAGVADPLTDEKCVRCHTAAWGLSDDMKGSKFSHEEGVTCESCHGAGKDYRKKKIMIDKEQAMANGLVEQNEQVCLKCHNDKSPAYKGFNYAEALKKIAHPVPEGYDPLADEPE